MYEVEVRTVEEQPTAVVRARVDEAGIGTWFAGAYATVTTHLRQAGVATVGLPFARCAKDATGFDVEAGLPVEQPIEGDDEVLPLTLPGGPAAVTWHQGAYATAEPAYEAIAEWLDREGREAAGPPWEIYHGDASTGPDATTWKTEIVQPLQA